jgi:hypothetical protein
MQKALAAQEEAKAWKTDFDALQAGWNRIYQAAVGWSEIRPSQLRGAVCDLLKGSGNALAVIEEIENSRPDAVMEDAGQLHPSYEDLAKGDMERDNLRRQLDHKENENERLRNEIERLKQQRDAPVLSAQSPDAYPSPAESTERGDTSTPLSNYGIEQTPPPTAGTGGARTRGGMKVRGGKFIKKARFVQSLDAHLSPPAVTEQDSASTPLSDDESEQTFLPAAPKSGAINHLAPGRQKASRIGKSYHDTASGVQKGRKVPSHSEKVMKDRQKAPKSAWCAHGVM